MVAAQGMLLGNAPIQLCLKDQLLKVHPLAFPLLGT